MATTHYNVPLLFVHSFIPSRRCQVFHKGKLTPPSQTQHASLPSSMTPSQSSITSSFLSKGKDNLLSRKSLRSLYAFFLTKPYYPHHTRRYSSSLTVAFVAIIIPRCLPPCPPLSFLVVCRHVRCYHSSSFAAS